MVCVFLGVHIGVLLAAIRLLKSTTLKKSLLPRANHPMLYQCLTPPVETPFLDASVAWEGGAPNRLTAVLSRQAERMEAAQQMEKEQGVVLVGVGHPPGEGVEMGTGVTLIVGGASPEVAVQEMSKQIDYIHVLVTTLPRY